MGRRIKLIFQGVGAHPWILEGRNGLARGIYNRLKADRCFTVPQILAEAQWCLNTLVSASGYSAYQLVFGSNPMDLYGWDDSEGDLLFAQDTSISGQFVQQWQLRIRAQEAALREIANSKLRRFWRTIRPLIAWAPKWEILFCFTRPPPEEEQSALERPGRDFGHR